MKKVVLPLVLLTLLTSCHAKPELRKDITEFIAQFSLSEAMAEYKTGGYTSTKEITEGERKPKLSSPLSIQSSMTSTQHMLK